MVGVLHRRRDICVLGRDVGASEESYGQESLVGEHPLHVPQAVHGYVRDLQFDEYIDHQLKFQKYLSQQDLVDIVPTMDSRYVGNKMLQPGVLVVDRKRNILYS
jgi:hypothetical protein